MFHTLALIIMFLFNSIILKIEVIAHCTDIYTDNEKLKIEIGSGIAIGVHSIAIGDDTNARKFERKERTDNSGFIDDFMYDPYSNAFIQTDK